uniref:Uncharacterized protein n=1 Tax=Oryzias sinensis TaxID=183150 RepID=A0A8C7YUR1_9TELE
MHYSLGILLCVGLLHQTASAVFMDKLAEKKICGDAECSYVLSMATALDDFIAPDCRFINIKKGQMVYVFLSTYQQRAVESSGLEVCTASAMWTRWAESDISLQQLLRRQINLLKTQCPCKQLTWTSTVNKAMRIKWNVFV